MTWNQVNTEQTPNWENLPQYVNYLITESGFNLVTESGYKLICEPEVPISPNWQNVTTDQNPNWALINTI